MIQWIILTATLPTTPSALRVRVWRALKATGAGSLREGVYLLPSTAPTAQALWDIERLIQQSGADAHLLVLAARDDAQDKAFQALFDRSELYTDLLQSIKEARGSMKSASEVELRRTLRGLDQQFHSVQASDFFPGTAGAKVSTALAALRHEAKQHLSPGEPEPRTEAIAVYSVEAFQHKTWATRERPWVDRLACAWLIQRFIDRAPKFIWLHDAKKCPKSALGFDFDGARFTHVGDKVSFEVMAQSFQLDTDDAIKALGQMVHYIDVGGIPVDAAPGIEVIVRGLLAQHSNDDKLMAAAVPVFDALYVAMKTRP